MDDFQALYLSTYRALSERMGGACPIEQGFFMRLADHECRHGRLPFDRSPACGCWRQEARVISLPEKPKASRKRRAA